MMCYFTALRYTHTRYLILRFMHCKHESTSIWEDDELEAEGGGGPQFCEGGDGVRKDWPGGEGCCEGGGSGWGMRMHYHCPVFISIIIVVVVVDWGQLLWTYLDLQDKSHHRATEFTPPSFSPCPFPSPTTPVCTGPFARSLDASGMTRPFIVLMCGTFALTFCGTYYVLIQICWLIRWLTVLMLLFQSPKTHSMIS
jgi:hypothetical protein